MRSAFGYGSGFKSTVNNAKDCGVRTDARRKREHGNGGKAGVFYEHSQCEL